MSADRGILVLNGGSSSLKYAVFDAEDAVLRGSIDHLGGDQAAAVDRLFSELASRSLAHPQAVGHRLVHGGPAHLAPARVDDHLLASLKGVIPFAPLHLPAELSAIEAVRTRFGDVPQVVCFDTHFHHTLPAVAQRYALPAALFQAGVRRYGFHGLSYEYIASTLTPAALRRAVFAHLGNGASLVAVREGRSIDTTMGFTPSAGLVMGTRCGDLDPGLLVYLLDHGYDARGIDRLVNHDGGLRALSETTSDMQALLAAAAHDERAALAIDLFCYQARRWIGAMAAALEGMETLVFTGGIGAHAAPIRHRICRGLGHLGVTLDDGRNAAGARVISSDGSRCQVLAVPTDEERVIARHTRRLLG